VSGTLLATRVNPLAMAAEFLAYSRVSRSDIKKGMNRHKAERGGQEQEVNSERMPLTYKGADDIYLEIRATIAD
jgi:hypothetical protein